MQYIQPDQPLRVLWPLIYAVFATPFVSQRTPIPWYSLVIMALGGTLLLLIHFSVIAQEPLARHGWKRWLWVRGDGARAPKGSDWPGAGILVLGGVWHVLAKGETAEFGSEGLFLALGASILVSGWIFRTFFARRAV